MVKNLFQLKSYNTEHLVRDFPSIGWNVGLVCKMWQKLQVTGLVEHHFCSGRRCSAFTADSIDLVDEVVLHRMSKQEIIFTHCT